MRYWLTSLYVKLPLVYVWRLMEVGKISAQVGNLCNMGNLYHMLALCLCSFLPAMLDASSDRWVTDSRFITRLCIYNFVIYMKNRIVCLSRYDFTYHSLYLQPQHNYMLINDILFLCDNDRWWAMILIQIMWWLWSSSVMENGVLKTEL